MLVSKANADYKLINVLERTAVRAGEAVLRYKKDLIISDKGEGPDNDLVTSADYNSENLILRQLSSRYPGTPIISEESNTNDDALFDSCFLIDPIDGTINYAHNVPIWGVQIAYIENYNVVACAISLPDMGMSLCADSSGSYMNDRRIHVSDTPLSKGLYCIEGVDRIVGRKELIELGYPHRREIYSTAASFSLVAQGAFAASVHIGTHPWDYMPGEFLVLKAGGFSYNNDRLSIHIVANTQENLDSLVDVFCRCREIQIEQDNAR